MSKPTARELLEAVNHHHPEAGSLARHELARRVEKVLALHSSYGIYDECGHDHDAEGPGVFDVAEVGLTCDDGLLYEVCRVCHLGHDGEPDEYTGDEHWPCPTVRLLNGEGE